jgi:hypothetical protein
MPLPSYPLTQIMQCGIQCCQCRLPKTYNMSLFMNISNIFKQTIYHIVLSLVISSISIGHFSNYAEAKTSKNSNGVFNGIFTSSENEQNKICTVFDSDSPLLINLGKVPEQILAFIDSIISNKRDESNMIRIASREQPSSSDIQKWITALPLNSATAGYSLSLALSDSLCEQIVLSTIVLERIWNGFKDAFIEAYGEDLWITLLKDLGFVAGGAALTMGYAALHATPVGWVIDLVVGTILVAWIAYNVYTFYDLISEDRYEDLGKQIFGQVNALVFGLTGVGAAAIAIKTIPSVATFISSIRSRVTASTQSFPEGPFTLKTSNDMSEQLSGGSKETFGSPKGLSDLEDWPVVEKGGSPLSSPMDGGWGGGFNINSMRSGNGSAVVEAPPISTAIQKSTRPAHAVSGVSAGATATGLTMMTAGLPEMESETAKINGEKILLPKPEFDPSDGQLGLSQEEEFISLTDANGGNNIVANDKLLTTESDPEGYRNLEMSSKKKRNNHKAVVAKPEESRVEADISPEEVVNRMERAAGAGTYFIENLADYLPGSDLKEKRKRLKILLLQAIEIISQPQQDEEKLEQLGTEFDSQIEVEGAFDRILIQMSEARRKKLAQVQIQQSGKIDVLRLWDGVSPTASWDEMIVRVDATDTAEALKFWDEILSSNNAKSPRIARWSLHFGIIRSSKQGTYDLTEIKSHSLSELLYLLSLTTKGREILNDFVPLFLDKKVNFKAVQSNQSSGIASSGVQAGYGLGIINIDYQQILLLALPNLLHEMKHAVDICGSEHEKMMYQRVEMSKRYNELLLKSISVGLTPIEADEMQSLREKIQEIKIIIKKSVLDYEHKAYRAQELFIEEFVKRFPVYSQAIKLFYRDHSKVYIGYPINKAIFSTLMIKAYDLTLEELEEYFKAHKWNEE